MLWPFSLRNCSSWKIGQLLWNLTCSSSEIPHTRVRLQKIFVEKSQIRARVESMQGLLHELSHSSQTSGERLGPKSEPTYRVRTAVDSEAACNAFCLCNWSGSWNGELSIWHFTSNCFETQTTAWFEIPVGDFHCRYRSSRYEGLDSSFLGMCKIRSVCSEHCLLRAVWSNSKHPSLPQTF